MAEVSTGNILNSIALIETTSNKSNATIRCPVKSRVAARMPETAITDKIQIANCVMFLYLRVLNISGSELVHTK